MTFLLDDNVDMHGRSSGVQGAVESASLSLNEASGEDCLTGEYAAVAIVAMLRYV